MSENISTPQGSTRLTPDMALDERLYDLTEEERTFFKQQTGIPSDDDLQGIFSKCKQSRMRFASVNLGMAGCQHEEENS